MSAGQPGGGSFNVGDQSKSFKGPVLKNGLHLNPQYSLNSPTNGVLLGSLPNSTKN